MRRAILILVAACGGGSGDPNAPGGSGSAAATGVTPRDAVVDAWKTGGLQPSAFAPATVPVGPDCKAGTVNGVDALVCAFPTPAAAKAAEAAAYTWVGAATGMVQIRGSLVIAAADRRKADPSGRTINQLMKLAPK